MKLASLEEHKAPCFSPLPCSLLGSLIDPNPIQFTSQIPFPLTQFPQYDEDSPNPNTTQETKPNPPTRPRFATNRTQEEAPTTAPHLRESPRTALSIRRRRLRRGNRVLVPVRRPGHGRRGRRVGRYGRDSSRGYEDRREVE